MPQSDVRFSVFNRRSRDRIQKVERLWITKFVTRVLSCVISIIALGLAAHAYNLTNQKGTVFVGYLVVLPFSILINLLNIAVRMNRRQPLPARANVALDLLVWAPLLIVTPFAAGVAALMNENVDHALANRGGDICLFAETSGSQSECFDGVLRTMAQVDMVVLVFGTVSLIVHFLLWVLACFDSRLQRGAGRWWPAVQAELHESNGRRQHRVEAGPRRSRSHNERGAW